MLAHNIVCLYMSDEWRGKSLKDLTPLYIKAGHLLALHATPLPALHAPTCCLTCRAVVSPTDIAYGKLMLYCDTCQESQPDESKLYYPASDLLDRLHTLLRPYYNVNLIEAIICQAIVSRHWYKLRSPAQPTQPALNKQTLSLRERLAGIKAGDIV